jgi:uncharacterized protein YjeT (DUF2065 family)
VNFALWSRRWGILALGIVFVLFGLAVFLSRSTLTFAWTAHAPVSGLSFYPGSPATYSMAGSEAHVAPNRYAAFSGQISITVGLVLMAGWVGFRLGRRRPPEEQIRSFTEQAADDLVSQD